jgi:gliding motility-associated-like protein
MAISPDGTKIACVEDEYNNSFNNAGVSLADFNNSTGIVSNEAFRFQNGNPHGCEFSANSRFLYVNSTSSGIYQFDCSGANNNSNLLARSLISNNPIYGSLRRGPDDNIYYTGNARSFLGRINNSNALSASVSHNYLSVGNSRMGYGIINMTLTSEPAGIGPNAIIAQNACFGTPVDFSLLSLENVLEVRWNFDDPNSGFLNSSFSNTPTHNFTAPGTYNVTAELTYSCGSEVLQIQVVIEETPEMNYLDTVRACADVNQLIGQPGENGVDYQWSPSNFLSDANAANPSFLHTGSQEREFYTYIITASSQISQCTASDTLVVELVTPQYEPIMDFPICAGDTVDVGPQPRDDYSYSWLPTTNIISATGSPVQFFNSENNPNSFLRNYAMQVTFDGCTLTDLFTVNFRAQIELTSDIPRETCATQWVTLNTGGNANWTYNWFADEGTITDASAINPYYTKDYIGEGKDSVFVYVDIEDEIGCRSRDSVQVIVSNRAGIQDYYYLCPGFGSVLNPFGEGVVFSWTPDYEIITDTSSNPIVSPLQDTTYFLTVTDVYNCTYLDSVFVEVNPEVPTDLGNDTTICFGDTAQLGVSFAVDSADYLWTPSVALDRDDSAHVRAFPLDTTTYFLEVSIDTCSGRDTITVNVAPLPVVVLESDTNICYGDSVLLLASGAETYIWGPDFNILSQNDSARVFPSDTTNYYVQGIDSLGCSNFDTVTVGVWSLPTIQLIEDTAICFGDSIQLNPTSNGNIFNWLPDYNVSNNSILNPYFNPETNTVYVLNVTDDNGCENEDSISVQVNLLPVINMTSDTTICDGDSVQLWASGGNDYYWTQNTVSDQNSRRTAGFVPEPNITYQVVVTTPDGCVDSSSVFVRWNQQPEAIFDFNAAFGCNGFTVQYADSSLNATGLSWNLGNGQTSDSRFPVVTYPFGFSGTTILTVNNNNICFDSASQNWDFDELSEVVKVDAVNVITPNQDKFNDCFEYSINGDFEDCDRLEVFNRWGLKVYDSQDSKECFNGFNIYNNQALNQGTYFYVIEINGFIRNGFIEVIP